MKTVTIRGIDFTCPEELHDYLASELSFPEYYGRNLDALYDILTGLPHRGSHFAITMPAEDAPPE